MWPKHLSNLPDKCIGCSSYDRLCEECTQQFLSWFGEAIEEDTEYWTKQGPYVIVDTFEGKTTIRDGRLPLEWTQRFEVVPAKYAHLIVADQNRNFHKPGTQNG